MELARTSLWIVMSQGYRKHLKSRVFVVVKHEELTFHLQRQHYNDKEIFISDSREFNRSHEICRSSSEVFNIHSYSLISWIFFFLFLCVGV